MLKMLASTTKSPGRPFYYNGHPSQIFANFRDYPGAGCAINAVAPATRWAIPAMKGFLNPLTQTYYLNLFYSLYGLTYNTCNPG